MKKWLLGGFCSLLLLAGCGSGGVVVGKVVLEGAADNSGVLVTLAGKDASAQVLTGADGVARFEGLSAGDYSLAFEAGDTAEGRRAMALKLAAGDVLEPAPVTLVAVGTVRGVATLGAGADHSGIRVVIGGSGASTFTDADGSYVLRNAPAGARNLIAQRDGYGSAILALQIPRGSVEAAPLVLARALPPGKVRGRVTLASAGAPTVIRIRSEGLDGLEATPAMDGTFTLSLPAGSHDLVAHAPGYPRLRLGNVNVREGETVELRPASMSVFHLIRPMGESNVHAEAILLDDERHAMVHRSFAVGGSSVGVLDLEEGRERTVMAISATFGPGMFINPKMGHTGRKLAFPSDGNPLLAPSWSILDSETGSVVSVAVGDTGPGRTTGIFSTDERFFFVEGVNEFIRRDLETGEEVRIPSGGVQTGVPAVFFVQSPSGESVHLVSATQAREVLTGVSRLEVEGNFAIAFTGCTGGIDCTLKIVDGSTGEVKAASGTFPLALTLDATNHPSWWKLTNAGARQLLRLDDAALSPLPAGFNPTLWIGGISPDGTRMAYTTGSPGAVVLHVSPLPAGAAPTPVASSTVFFDFEWIGPTRLVAFDDTATPRVLDYRNDTMTEHTDVRPDSAMLAPGGATWISADGKKALALHGDWEAVQVLAESSGATPMNAGFAGATSNGTRSVWVALGDEGASTTVRDEAGASVHRVDGAIAIGAALTTMSQGDRSVLLLSIAPAPTFSVLDLASGHIRSTSEPEVDLRSPTALTPGGLLYGSGEYLSVIDGYGPVTMPAIVTY